MGNKTILTIHGFAGSVPDLRQKPDSQPWARFRLGTTSTSRGEDGVWRDDPTVWVTVKAFRDLAVRASVSVRKGTPLVVTGKLQDASWKDGAGTKHEVIELVADTIAISLVGRGTVIHNPPLRREGEEPSGHASDPGASLADQLGGAPSLSMVPDDAASLTDVSDFAAVEDEDDENEVAGAEAVSDGVPF